MTKLKKINFPFKSILISFISYLSGDSLVKVLKFLLLPWFLHLISLEEIGTLFIFESCLILLEPLYSLGTHYYLSRYSTQDDSVGNKIALFRTIWGIILSILLILICKTICVIFQFNILNLYIFLTIGGSFLYSSSLYVQHCFVGKNKPVYYSIYNISNILLYIVCIYILVKVYHIGFVGIAIANIISSLVFFQYQLRTGFIFKRLTTTEIKEYLSFGLPFIPLTFMLLLIVFVDRIILSMFVKKDIIGIYGIGYQFASLLSFIGVALKYAIMPILYKETGINSKIINSYKSLLKIILPILFLMTIFVFLIEKQLFILLGVESIYISNVFKIIWVAMLFCFFYILFEPIMVLMNKTKLLSIIILLAALLNIIVNFLLIPSLGIIGAALATLSAYALIFFSIIIILFRNINWSLIEIH